MVEQRKEILVRMRGSDDSAFPGCVWTFRRGQQWVVMGPNGAGKSYLAGLLSGKVPLCGLDITFHEHIEDHVALVTFSQQQDQASGSWLQARWHGQEREDAVTVRQFLSYEAVNEINPYQVRQKDTAKRRAFAGLRNRTAALLHLRPRQEISLSLPSCEG